MTIEINQPVLASTADQPTLIAERTVDTTILKKAIVPFKAFNGDIWVKMDGYLAGDIIMFGIDSAHVSMVTSTIKKIVNAFGACHVDQFCLDGDKLVKAISGLNAKIEHQAWFQLMSNGDVVLKTIASTITLVKATNPDIKERDLLASFEQVLRDKWSFSASFLNTDAATITAALKSCAKFSDLVQLTRDDATHGLMVEATAEHESFKLDCPTSEEFDAHGNGHGIYSLRFLSWLQTMPKSTRKNHATIGVNLGIDIPARICYRNLDLDITCLLAPRIKCEDEDEDVNDSQDVDDIDAIDEP